MMRFLTHTKDMETLLGAQRRLILYHRDIDGTTSAALLMKFFPSDAISLQYKDFPLLVKRVEDAKPDLLVILDLSIDQFWKDIRHLEKTTKILVIDHHVIFKDLNSPHTLHVNPRFAQKDAYLPAAYLVYHILKAMGKAVLPYSWISGIGVIGDYAFEECKDVLDEVRKTDPDHVAGHPRSSRLGMAGNLISSAITLWKEKGAQKALDILLKAKKLEDFENNKELIEGKRTVEKDIEMTLKRFEKEKEVFPEKKCIIYQLRTSLSISSAVSTTLGERYPDMTILIVQQSEGGYKLSLRNQSGKINLNDIVKKASEGIGTAGGHEKAAGGFVENFELFKKRFLASL